LNLVAKLEVTGRPLPAIQIPGLHGDPATIAMLKKIALAGLCTTIVIALLLWGIHYGYRRGYADGSQSTNAWWIDKKGLQFDTSEVIKKRLRNNHQSI
jgi:hypothetical protein